MKATSMPTLSAIAAWIPGAPYFVLALLIVGSNTFAQAPLKPLKLANYRPFSIVSSKLQREVPDTFIEERLMCRSTLTTMAELMDLLQNYDLLRTDAMDGSLSMTTFRGRQDGKYVEVNLFVETSNRRLSSIWVAGKPMFSCI